MIASLVTVFILAGYSLYVLSPAFTTLIQENTEKEAVRIGRYMATLLFRMHEPLQRDNLPPRFLAKLEESVQNFALVKIKVFSAAGEIVYSTVPEEIGTINDKRYFHEQVARGRTFTKIVEKDHVTLEGQRFQADIVETYVPIMEDDRFLGAFEIYFDITESVVSVEHLVQHSHYTLFSIATVLLLAQLITALKARRWSVENQRSREMILEQSTILKEKNSELEVLNDISEAISRSIDINVMLPQVLTSIMQGLTRERIITVERACLFLLDNKKLELVIGKGHGGNFEAMHRHTPAEECFCGMGMDRERVVVIDDVREAGRHTCCGTDEPHGHVIIPLRAANRVIGVLNLFTPCQAEVATKLHIFENIGNQLGIACANARHHSEIKRLSLHDPLTGLANRRFMEKSLEQLIAQAARYDNRLSLAMFDIDHFKAYNDKYGHQAGDRILRKVAEIIAGQIRRADLAVRYGGEEFVLILPETGLDNGMWVADEIRKQVQGVADVTISGGVACLEPGMTAEALVKAADQALYRAKGAGRNRVERAESSGRSRN